MPLLRYWDVGTAQYIPISGATSPGMYTQVGPTPPNASAPVISPPQGFLWVDTSSSTGTTLPPPLASGAPFTTYTDSSTGKIYVAKGGVNGGAWKDPRDILHSRVMRNAIYTVPSGTVIFPYDTIDRDPYALYTIGTSQWTIPVAGIYLVTSALFINTTAINQVMALYLFRNGSRQSQGSSLSTWTGSGGISIEHSGILYCSAGDVVAVYSGGNTALSTQYTDPTINWASLSYQGTG